MITKLFFFFGGLNLIGIGSFFLFNQRKNKLIETKLEVIGFEEQEDHEYNSIDVPVFKVLSGEHQGFTKMGMYDSESSSSYKTGDLLDGYIELREMNLISKNSLPMMKWIPIGTLVLGLVFLLISFYLYFSE